MDEYQIKLRMNDLANFMMENGLKTPRALFTIPGNEDIYIFLSWDDGSDLGKFSSFRKPTFDECFQDAYSSVADLPSKEEINKQNFMNAVDRAIYIGKEANIDMVYISPLLDTIKNLSENIITGEK